jgi:hypothetical protein
VISDGDLRTAVNFAIKLNENVLFRKQIEKNARQFALDNFSGKQSAEVFLRSANKK